MRAITDDRLEKWIKLKLDQHKLPQTVQPRLCTEQGEVPSTVLDVLANTQVGKLLLLVFQSDDRWTVLGTNSLVSSHSGSRVEVALDEVGEISALGLGDIPKECYEFLQIQDKAGKVQSFWCFPGPVFFAMWNILLGIRKMQQ